MGRTPQDWSPTAREVLEEPLLHIPLMTNHPLWLAITGEVLTWRNEMDVPTVVVDFTTMDLFDSSERSFFARTNQAARLLRQDSVARLRRYLSGTGGNWNTSWLDASHFSGLARQREVPSSALTVAELNVTSESLSLTNSRFVGNLLSPETRHRMSESWMSVYRTYSMILELQRPSAVLLFNGRFVKEGAARAAAIDQGVTTYGFDQGASPNSWAVYRNHIHDYDAIVDDVERIWMEGNPEELTVRFSQWLEQRIESPGGGGNEHSIAFGAVSPFAGAGAAPRVAVFTSSSDELVSIDSGSQSGPDNQARRIRELLNLAALDRIDLQIRVHPYTSTKHAWDIQEWEDIARQAPSKVQVHLPQSGVDSYSLVREADIVLTFGSTLTAEAAFMGSPVVELCDTHLSRLGVCSRADSMAELERFLAEPAGALRPRQKTQAVKYAAWLNLSGEPLHFAELNGVDGAIGGRPMEPFGRAFLGCRRAYRSLLQHGLPDSLQSHHGLMKQDLGARDRPR